MNKKMGSKYLSLLIVFVMLLISPIGVFAGSASDRFSDRQDFKEKQSESVLDYLTGKGLLKGKPDAKGGYNAAINDTISRAEFVTLIVRCKLLAQYVKDNAIEAGKDTLPDDFIPKALSNTINGFNTNLVDIKGHWAEQYIKFAESEGLNIGYSDRTFKPDKAIIFEEVSSIAYNASSGLVDISLKADPSIKKDSNQSRLSALLLVKNFYEAISGTSDNSVTGFSSNTDALLEVLKSAKSIDEAMTAVDEATIKGAADKEIYALIEAAFANKSWTSDDAKKLQAKIVEKGGWVGKYYDEKMQTIWPSNNGFKGDIKTVTLQPGTKIDRYGYPTGRFSSPVDTPYENRALQPGTKETTPYNVYEVLKPFDVQAGEIAPWFGMPGEGIQYYLSDGRNYQNLLDAGIMRKVN